MEAARPAHIENAYRELMSASQSEFSVIDTKGNDVSPQLSTRQQLLDKGVSTDLIDGSYDSDGEGISPPLSEQQQREFLDKIDWQQEHARDSFTEESKRSQETGGDRGDNKSPENIARMARNTRAAEAIAKHPKVKQFGLSALSVTETLAYLVVELSGQVRPDESIDWVKKRRAEAKNLLAARCRALQLPSPT